MIPTELEDAVDAVAWSLLGGAYGPSDGANGGGIARALLTLASATDPESDDARDALDVLQSHAFHQGDIYEVTAHVVPFAFELADTVGYSMRADLGYFLANAMDSAVRYVATSDVDKQRIGHTVLAAFAARIETSLGWIGGELEAVGVFLASRLKTFHPAMLAALETRGTFTPEAFLALRELESLPAWVVSRAVDALGDVSAPRRIAAAILLAGRAPASELAHRLELILTLDAAAKLGSSVELPFDIRVPAVTTPFAGPMQEGTVLFVGQKLVTVRIAGPRNVSLPWVDSPLAKGTVIRVGLSPSGVVRVAEYTSADGMSACHTFS